MIECIWILIKDGANPLDVIQKAQDGMGDDGLIVALRPVDDIVRTAGEVIMYKLDKGVISLIQEEDNES